MAIWIPPTAASDMELHLAGLRAVSDEVMADGIRPRDSIRPTHLAGIDTVMVQKKALQMQSFLAEDLPGCRSRPNQVSHRFMGVIWHPYSVSLLAGCGLASIRAFRRSGADAGRSRWD